MFIFGGIGFDDNYQSHFPLHRGLHPERWYHPSALRNSAVIRLTQQLMQPGFLRTAAALRIPQLSGLFLRPSRTFTGLQHKSIIHHK